MKRSEAILERIRKSEDYNSDYENSVLEAIRFWKDENTNTKIRNSFTEEMKSSLADDNYNTAIGAAYPLYRIAGSHLDYKKLLKFGINGLIDLIKVKLDNCNNEDSAKLYSSMIEALKIFTNVCDLYIAHVSELISNCEDKKRIEELKLIKQSLDNIKINKPQTLHEAMQLVNLYAICAGSTELARIDNYLGNFYMNDINNGTISREDAVLYVDSLFRLFSTHLARDTRAIIGGKGRDNEKNADEFALVVLDAIERRHANLPQVSLRYYKGIDSRVYKKSLDLLGNGRTFPIIYNDDVNVKSVMHAMDVPLEAAEQYGFFGCGEYMLAAKSIGTPNTLINMAKILEVTLNNGVDPISKKLIGLSLGKITENTSFEELFEMYKKQTEYFVDNCGKFQELVYDKCNEECSFLFASILYDDCIERGKAIFDGGIYHLGGTLETYGNITTSDSLAAIKEIVYDKKAFSITTLIKMLSENFKGYEIERRMLLAAQKFGNDYPLADEIAVKVHEHICNSIRNQREKTRLDSLLVVMINNNMNILLGKNTGATPDGRQAFEFLSNGNGAYAGMDKEGITALMNSMTKLDTSIHAGANHNLKFSTSWFRENRDKLEALLQTYFDMGGQQTNISVVNQADLEDALICPEKHENLFIRVGGFTSRFNDLDKATQLDILKRTAY